MWVCVCWAHTRHMLVIGSLMVGLPWSLNCSDDRFAIRNVGIRKRHKNLFLFVHGFASILIFQSFYGCWDVTSAERCLRLPTPRAFENHLNMCVWAHTHHMLLVGSWMVSLPWWLDCIDDRLAMLWWESIVKTYDSFNEFMNMLIYHWFCYCRDVTLVERDLR